jgi:hypothetical protein
MSSERAATPQRGRPWCCYRAPFGTGVLGSAPHKKLSPSLRESGNSGAGSARRDLHSLPLSRHRKVLIQQGWGLLRSNSSDTKLHSLDPAPASYGMYGYGRTHPRRLPRCCEGGAPIEWRQRGGARSVQPVHLQLPRRRGQHGALWQPWTALIGFVCSRVLPCCALCSTHSNSQFRIRLCASFLKPALLCWRI